MDEHVNVLAWRGASYVNDSDMLQEQIGRLGRRERGREQERESENEPHEGYWTPQNGDLFPVGWWVVGNPESAGINRHVVGDERALQERKAANPSWP